MSPAGLPEINALIEITISGGAAYPSRIDGVEGNRLTVAAPLNLLIVDLPEVGRRLTVRWSAGARGRNVAPAKIVGIQRAQVASWELELTGPPEIEQNRRYVRGGGGEPIRLTRALSAEDQPVDARVVDVSERSVRGRFSGMKIKAGDPVTVRLRLDDEVIEVTGSVLRVIEQPEPKVIDVVVVYDPDESQASIIRRHVMRQQLLDRARASRA